MLSQPRPPIVQSVARHRVINSSQTSSGSRPLAIRRVTKSTTSCKKSSGELESERSGKHKHRSTDLIRQDVPDAVAGENDELPIVVDRLDGNLGATRDNLLRKASRENKHLTPAQCNSSNEHSFIPDLLRADRRCP